MYMSAEMSSMKDHAKKIPILMKAYIIAVYCVNSILFIAPLCPV